MWLIKRELENAPLCNNNNKRRTSLEMGTIQKRADNKIHSVMPGSTPPENA
jgi:hypothetical protein